MSKLNPAFQWVGITSIQHRDRTFAVRSSPSPSPALLKSIRRYGVISPLTLQQVEDDGYRIICGFRRCRAARDLGLTALPARVLAKAEPRDLFETSLTENLWSEPLSDFEKGTVIARLYEEFGVSQEEIIADYLELLGIKQDPFHFSQYRSVSRLPGELRERLAEIPVATALALARWTSSDRSIYLDVLDRLRPTHSHQKELLQLLGDLRERSRRQPEAASSLGEMWKSAGCPAVLENQELNRSTAIEAILAGLRRLCRPELDRMNWEYHKQIDGLNVPGGVNLCPPRFFEGDKIDVHFSLTSAAQLETVARQLLRMARQPELHNIFELL